MRTLTALLLAVMLGGCGGAGKPTTAGPSTASPSTTPGVHSVFYRVTGAVDTAKVTYTVPGQPSLTEFAAVLPWKKEISTDGGHMISVSGNTADNRTELACEIWVDGSIKVTRTGVVAYCATTVEDETVEPTDAAPSDGSIPGDGTFAVGDEVRPGTYRSAGPVEGSCYWARLRSLAAGPDDIIANGNSEGPVTVRILRSDEGFETTGCQAWERVKG